MAISFSKAFALLAHGFLARFLVQHTRKGVNDLIHGRVVNPVVRHEPEPALTAGGDQDAIRLEPVTDLPR